MNNETLRNLFKKAPVSINCQLGDPFQKTQWEGTKQRIVSLDTNKHIGAVCTITKSIISDEQIEWMRDNIKNINFIIFFSITGLKEKYPLDKILDNFKKVSLGCPNVKTVVFIRPIIPSQNDNIDILRPIVETAAKYAYNHYVIFRGYKDIENNCENVVLDQKFISDFHNLCDELGATILHKTRDLSNDFGNDSLHNLTMSDSEAKDFLETIGYGEYFKVDDGKIYRINSSTQGITRGDVHFVEMFTGLQVTFDKENYNHDRSILSIDLFGHNNIDATSSWLGWGENRPCIIGCPYCIAYAEHKDYKYFGTDYDNII